MPRIKLTIEYNGAAFNGWQIQPDAHTVEGAIEQALERILQQPVDVLGQGRTDAGVHAKGQTAHLDIPEGINIQKLVRGVNGLVGENIQIVDWKVVSADFHARFDALTREYEYRVLKYNSPLLNSMGWWPGFVPEFSSLEHSAKLVLGEHDFSGFSKFNPDNYTTLCDIGLSEWEELDEMVIYRVRANRFLRNMVRRLVGTMVEVAAGKMDIQDFEHILSGKKTQASAFTAPAKALILNKVLYK